MSVWEGVAIFLPRLKNFVRQYARKSVYNVTTVRRSAWHLCQEMVANYFAIIYVDWI